MDERLRDWRRLQRDRKIAPMPEGLADDVWRGLEHEPEFERPSTTLERQPIVRVYRVTLLDRLVTITILITALLALAVLVAQLVASGTCGS